MRDSGLVHALLDLASKESVLSHPVIGASWQGFCIENLLACAPTQVQAFFYRSGGGAEVDLILQWPGKHRSQRYRLASVGISNHTWPERQFAALDLFMCAQCDPRHGLPALQAFFQPGCMAVKYVRPGLVVDPQNWAGGDPAGRL